MVWLVYVSQTSNFSKTLTKTRRNHCSLFEIKLELSLLVTFEVELTPPANESSLERWVADSELHLGQ